MEWDKQILKLLLESFYKSKKALKTNINNYRTQLKIEKLYKKYKSNDADFDKIDAINSTASELCKMGFIECQIENFSTNIISIFLVEEKIKDIEKYMYDRYGYTSVGRKKSEISNIIEQYSNKSAFCKNECELLKGALNKNRIPQNYDKLPEIFDALAFIENNKRELYIREASMEIYGSSKYFEENTISSVCKILRKYNNKPCDNDELLNEILDEYGIKKEPQKLCVKGNFSVVIDGKELSCDLLKSGLEFYAEELSRIEKINIKTSKFMTIENKTAYLRYYDYDTTIFYLGGYANRFQRDFIKKVYMDNFGVRYLHFGDIDAGGFYIHNNLCEITGIKFDLFSMSINELSNNRYSKSLQNLTENDISRLNELSNNIIYSDTVKYMLKNNVKLEQEIISLDLME